MGLLSMIFNLGLNATNYEQGMKKAKDIATDFGHHVTSTIGAAFGAHAMAEFIGHVVSHGAELKKLSMQFEITAEDVQKIEKAASKAGLEFDDFATAFRKLGAERKSAGEGDEEARKRLADFGVSLADINDPAKSNLDIMRQIATTLETMKLNPALRTELDELLGRKGQRLAAALRLMNAQKAPYSNEEVDDMAEVDKDVKKAKAATEHFFGGGVSAAMAIARRMKKGFEKDGILGALDGLFKDDAVNEEINATGGALPKPDKDPLFTRKYTRAENDAWAKAEDEFWGIGPKKKEKAYSAYDPKNFDALAKIGGFGAQGDSGIVAVAKKQLVQLEQINDKIGGGDFDLTGGLI